jgi:hypothetical protein
MTRNNHNKDKKLHNSDEKLHNSEEPDLTWQEMADLSPEDEVERGSFITIIITQSRSICEEDEVADQHLKMGTFSLVTLHFALRDGCKMSS